MQETAKDGFKQPTVSARPPHPASKASPRPSPTPQASLVAAGDFVIAFGLLFMTAFSWAVPERLWGRFAGLCAPLAVRFLPVGPNSLVERIRRMAGQKLPLSSPEALAGEVVAGFVEENMQLLKSYRPDGWEPEIRLLGEEHIAAALASGHGAVLWVGNFTYYSLTAKIALHRAGFAVSHFSDPAHGFSRTRFGMRFLNPIRTRIEELYLKERVIADPGIPVRALKRLHQCLEANGIVSIAARGRALRPEHVPFLEGSFTLGSGAPNIAAATGAALLPVFTIYEKDGSFTVTVEPPLNLSKDKPRREALDCVFRQYAARLEHYVLKHPQQWNGWLGG
jgi:lauroyl/myristoyl acyltransferase